MIEFSPSPELEQKIRAAAAAPNPDPAFVGRLRSQLVERSAEMKPRPNYSPGLLWRFALAVLFVLICATLLIGPQRIVNAMRELFGYIPGIGMVSQSAPVRTLAEPVSQTRDGITITVKQAVLDAEHSVLIYQVDGLPAGSRFSGPLGSGEMPPACMQIPVLHLPDGSELEANGAYDHRDWVSGYEDRFTYPALPANLAVATLHVACIDTTLSGAAPVDWEIPLHFVPVPPQMTVYPVIDVATPQVTASPSVPASAATQPGSTQLVFPYGISLGLDKIVPMQDGYLLQTRMQWSGNGLAISPPPDGAQVRLLDTNGREIRIGAVQSDQPYAPDSHQVFMDYKTAPIDGSGPLTFSVDSISVDLSTTATFTFDPGQDPKPGQTWQLDRDIELAGYHLRVLTAQMISMNGNETGYSFDMQSASGISSAMLNDLEHPVVSGGGGSGGDTFSSEFNYAGPAPKGPITVTVTSITVRLTGPWQVSWTPPTGASGGKAPTAQSGAACQPLTSDGWKQALAHPGSVPQMPAGKLAFDNWIQNGEFTPWNAAVASSDGKDLRRLGEGNSASFSPDGLRAAFSTQTGFAIVNLASGEKTMLPGNATDFYPLWSPDGKQLAYMTSGSQFDLFTVDVDGSNRRQITNTPESEMLVAWTADGTGLVYSVEGPNGNALRSIDLKSGATQTLFAPDRHIFSYVLSPDGKRLASNERRPGDDDDQLYVSNLDGSGRRLLVDVKPSTVSAPAWSPDGAWLAITITPPDSPTEKTIPVIALFQVDTCQVIPLPTLQGNITAWGP